MNYCMKFSGIVRLSQTLGEMGTNGMQARGINAIASYIANFGNLF